MLNLIEKYFPELTEHQKCLLSALEKLYVDWNAKINIISRKDIMHFQERHLLHSLSIAKVIQFKQGTNILDVGTGGGLPGIPLSILFPDSSFVLIDSIGKKIKIVNAIIDELKLPNVKAYQSRVEEIDQPFDFVLGRAVTSLPVFTDWVKNKIKKNEINSIANGILYLKGGDLNDELLDFKRPYDVYQIKDYFQEEYFETKKIVHVKF